MDTANRAYPGDRSYVAGALSCWLNSTNGSLGSSRSVNHGGPTGPYPGRLRTGRRPRIAAETTARSRGYGETKRRAGRRKALTPPCGPTRPPHGRRMRQPLPRTAPLASEQQQELGRAKPFRHVAEHPTRGWPLLRACRVRSDGRCATTGPKVATGAPEVGPQARLAGNRDRARHEPHRDHALPPGAGAACGPADGTPPRLVNEARAARAVAPS